MSQSGSAGPAPDAFPVRRSFGGGGVLYANRHRAKHQSGVTANTVAKILLTGSALGPTVYSGILGANTAQGDGHSAAGAIEPSGSTPNDVAKAQRQLRYLQLALPALTGAIVVLGAQQGEQQRPDRFFPESRTHWPAERD